MNIHFSIQIYNYLFIIGIILIACTSNQGNSAEHVPESRLPTNPTPLEPEREPVQSQYLLGKFDPAQHPDFVQLKAPYAGGNAIGRYLRKEAFQAFKDMHSAAEADGVSLVILSATRNFDSQKAIWEAKWTGKRLVGGKNLRNSLPDPARRAKEILLYSSMPGTSRHHWGTDIDVNAFTNSYFESGVGKKTYDWLNKHAADYGFCQPYTNKSLNARTGYEEERWHWSYMPISHAYLQAYREQVSIDEIEGFQGAETAQSLQVIQNYVEGIDLQCK